MIHERSILDQVIESAEDGKKDGYPLTVMPGERLDIVIAALQRLRATEEPSPEDRHSAKVQFAKYLAMQGLLMRISGSSSEFSEVARRILAGEFPENPTQQALLSRANSQTPHSK